MEFTRVSCVLHYVHEAASRLHCSEGVGLMWLIVQLAKCQDESLPFDPMASLMTDTECRWLFRWRAAAVDVFSGCGPPQVMFAP